MLRVRGVEYRAHIVLVVLGGLMLLAAPSARDLTLASCLPMSILAHELGHAWMARRRRQRVLSVDVGPLWGFCRYEGYHDAFDRGLIAAAGPGVTLAITVVAATASALVAAPAGSWLDSLLGGLWAWNLIAFAMNMMPVRALDGAAVWPLVPMLWRRGRASRLRRSPKPKPARRADVPYLRAVDARDEDEEPRRRAGGGPTLH